MSDVPNSRSPLSDGIRMTLVTRRAEKGFFALDPLDQERVKGDLCQPVPGNRYRKLNRWASVGLFHFDVTGSVRVTSLEVDGKACVVHIGPHDEFDKFVDQFDGQLPQHPKPLEESRIMKNVRPQSTKVPTLPPARPVQPAATVPAAKPSTPPEAADAFGRYVSLLFEAGFAKERERLNDEVLQFADSVTAVRSESATATAALSERLDRHGEAVARLETAVAEASLATAGQFGRVDSELTTLAGQVDEVEAACGRTHAALAEAAAGLNRDLLRVGDEVASQGRRLEELGETLAGRLALVVNTLNAGRIAPLETRCDELAEGLVTARQTAVCQEAEYRRFVAEVTRERNEWREAMADVRRELTTVRRRLDAHERERVEAETARRERTGWSLGGLLRRLARLVSFGSKR